MKKILSMLLAVAMFSTISSSVLAGSLGNETIVTYYIPENYTVTIPEIITVGQYEDNDVVITATTSFSPNDTLIINVVNGIEPMEGMITLNDGHNNFVDTYLYFNDINLGYERRIDTTHNAVARFIGQNVEARDIERPLKIKAINPNGFVAGTYTSTIQFDVYIEPGANK